MTGLEIIIAVLFVWVLALTYLVVVLIKLNNLSRAIIQDLIDEVMK